MKKWLHVFLSTTHIILLSFLVTILCGGLLLTLPIASANGQGVSFLDALFTATSATCVTGLVVLPTVTTWSTFGQIVILLLIQIGGLGLITILSAMTILFHRKIGISDRLLLQDAFNLNSLSGIVGFIKKVVAGTLLVEGVGALLYMPVFIPRFGAYGIWVSVFNSVSAFCNAGLDIIAEDSLCGYIDHPLVNIVTACLIILGGIGYIVWWDVIRVLKSPDIKGRHRFSHLTLHTKIALSTTACLIFGGGLLILIFEYHNPLTIGNLSFGEKVMAALFQSITTRTAGFATVAQENLTGASTLVCILLMFIGGSPVGTAGGVKTVTIAVLGATAVAAIRQREHVTMFGRTLSKKAVGKATAVTCMSFLIVFISTVLLAAFIKEAFPIAVIYETVSAAATVGLSQNLTSFLNTAGKIIIIFTMYLGRVGPISLAVALNFFKKQSQNIIQNPTQEISVG